MSVCVGGGDAIRDAMSYGTSSPIDGSPPSHQGCFPKKTPILLLVFWTIYLKPVFRYSVVPDKFVQTRLKYKIGEINQLCETYRIVCPKVSLKVHAPFDVTVKASFTMVHHGCLNQWFSTFGAQRPTKDECDHFGGPLSTL